MIICSWMMNTSVLILLLLAFPCLSAHANLMPLMEMPGGADVVIQGSSGVFYMGRSISNSGDVNGDGFSDIVIGAPGSSPPGGLVDGQAYIIFGGEYLPKIITIPQDADVVINPEGDGALGKSVSNAGDVNGDGIDDVLVSDYIVAGGKGAAYLLLGRRIWPSTINLGAQEYDARFMGAQDDWAGYSVAIGGDVNGDGLCDILIGATGKGTGGGAYLIFGRSMFAQEYQLDIEANVGFQGERLGDSTGQSVSCGGDVNGDGLSDILIGAPGHYNGSLQYSGRAYLLYGRNSFPPNVSLGTDSNAIFYTDYDYQALGSALSDRADINGDGLSDIVITAPGISYEHYKDGGQYIVFGSSILTGFFNLNQQADVLIFGVQDDETIGDAICADGDVNGDGWVDILPAGESLGRAYVVNGGNDLPATIDLGNESTVWLNNAGGTSIDNGGDINGDGIADIVLGNDLGGNGGEVYIIYGSPLPLTLKVRKNSNRSDNERVFRGSELLILEYEIHPDNGNPTFSALNLLGLLGVQSQPNAPPPYGGGQISLFDGRLKTLTPVTSINQIIPTFPSLCFSSLPNPFKGTINFAVPVGVTGRFCFIGTVADNTGNTYTGIVRSNIFTIECQRSVKTSHGGTVQNQPL